MKNKKTITIALTGGLGNQLFQVAAGLCLAEGGHVELMSKPGRPRLNKNHEPEIYSFELPSNVKRIRSGHSTWLLAKVIGYNLRSGISPNRIEKLTHFATKFVSRIVLFICSGKNRKIVVSDNLNNLNEKYDIITMFHVLEHIPYQVKTLKELKKKLTKNGKIIIEVPSAEDFLLKLKEFKKFTFWSEHLILHTENSLRKILEVSGFKKINIKYYQRYNFSNHLGWFIKRMPGGHNSYKNISDAKINKEYSDYLIRRKSTDTLIAIANN
jgi:SAM-dependent methyltransferase